MQLKYCTDQKPHAIDIQHSKQVQTITNRKGNFSFRPADAAPISSELATFDDTQDINLERTHEWFYIS